MQKLLLVALLVGCAVPARRWESSSGHVRWPEHRHHHDEQLDKLETDVAALRREVADLQHQLAALRAQE